MAPSFHSLGQIDMMQLRATRSHDGMDQSTCTLAALSESCELVARLSRSRVAMFGSGHAAQRDCALAHVI
jgi:hypothetical protein